MTNLFQECCYDHIGVTEGIYYKAYIDRENGGLHIRKPVSSEIELIICGTCGREFGESDFEEIHF